jgi:uncharacterized protein (TIGR02246 family)
MIFDQARLCDFATRYTAAWCSQNAPSVASFFSPDGRLSVNGATPAVGREAIAELVQGFMTAFPDLRVMLDDVFLQGDRVVYRWTLSGTNTAPGGTGNPVRISGFEQWSLGNDGLIADSQGQYDSAAHQKQLGHGLKRENFITAP